MNKIVIVGCGSVGMAYAFSLINQKSNIDELILIDKDNKKALGNAIDLSHTALYNDHKVNIKAGSYIDCKDAKIVVIAAGVRQKPKETRLNLVSRNKIIIKEIVEKIVASGFKGIFLNVTNPVDIITYYIKKYSKFPSNKVIGTGTTIDTARCKYLLSEKLEVRPTDIDLYVVGEHGDSLIIPYSSAKVGALDIKDIMITSDLKQIETKVKKLPYKIIELKGETSFTIAMCLTRITNAIIDDEYAVLTVSAPYNGIYIGMPSVINKNGIKGVMKIKLTNEEAKKLEDSIEIIENTISSMED